jgi:hypothetical protein
MLGLVGLGLSALTAHAWNVSGIVRCPSGRPDVGATVSIPALNLSTTTDSSGAYSIDLPDAPFRGKICLDTSTGTTGLSVKGNGCQNFSVDEVNMFVLVNFVVNGPSCSCIVPPACWLTGGGTISDTSASPHYSFGGVVYPGCSPRAAGGGNWNVVDHLAGLHFKGLDIIVDDCCGVPTSSPPVNVNEIDFHGTGIISGIEGNAFPTTCVTFVGHAEDHAESGSGVDVLYIVVTDCTSGQVYLSITGTAGAACANSPSPFNNNGVFLSTGNLQIHTSGCAKD